MNYRIIITILTICTMAASCSKKLLDLNPSNAISLDQAFEQVSDAQQWDNGMYATLRNTVYGQYMFATDIQADELNATLDYGNNYGFLQTWAGFLADDYTISGNWSGYYYAITNINVALNGFKQIKLTSAQDSTQLNQYTGDAYLARAYYYLQLVLRWSKAYDPSSASTDPGVPLVLVYDINAQPSRATVAAVYDQILSDLAQAKTLLAGVAGTPGSTYFTSDVALALEARTKLYMQDWAGAQADADALINSGTYPLVTDEATFTSMWTNDLPNESILQLAVSQPNEVPNNEYIYLNYNSAAGALDPLYVPSQWVVDLFDPSDIRRGTYFVDTNVVIQGNSYSGIYLVNKYPGNPELFTSAVSNAEQAPKVFRIAEMYLISAEAAAQAGNGTAATTTLNALRVARGVSTFPGSLSADSLQNAIRIERTRELAFEGFRLDDLKRWNQGFTRHDPQNPAILVPGPNFATLSEPAGAPKYVWGIPANDITINPHLVQNPGW